MSRLKKFFWRHPIIFMGLVVLILSIIIFLVLGVSNKVIMFTIVPFSLLWLLPGLYFFREQENHITFIDNNLDRKYLYIIKVVNEKVVEYGDQILGKEGVANGIYKILRAQSHFLDDCKMRIQATISVSKERYKTMNIPIEVNITPNGKEFNPQEVYENLIQGGYLTTDHAIVSILRKIINDSQEYFNMVVADYLGGKIEKDKLVEGIMTKLIEYNPKEKIINLFSNFKEVEISLDFGNFNIKTTV